MRFCAVRASTAAVAPPNYICGAFLPSEFSLDVTGEDILPKERIDRKTTAEAGCTDNCLIEDFAEDVLLVGEFFGDFEVGAFGREWRFEFSDRCGWRGRGDLPRTDTGWGVAPTKSSD